jgi:inosose dehydratase
MRLRRSDRRCFLQTTASAAAALTLGSWSPSPSLAAEPAFGDWPIGIQSYSLRNFPVHEAIRHLQALQVHNVEMFSAHFALNSSDEAIQQMLNTLERAQIKLRAHGVNEFTADHAANRAIFEFAKKARMRNITANPQPDSFDSLDKLVEEYDVRICIHNHGPGALYDTLDNVANAVKNHHPHIGACIDTGHVLRSNQDPVQWVKTLGPRVFAMHLKDVAEKTKKTHDVVIGTSYLRLVDLFKALQDAEFPSDGAISLEYEANPDNPIEDIRQCLVAAADAIATVG